MMESGKRSPLNEYGPVVYLGTGAESDMSLNPIGSSEITTPNIPELPPETQATSNLHKLIIPKNYGLITKPASEADMVPLGRYAPNVCRTLREAFDKLDDACTHNMLACGHGMLDDIEATLEPGLRLGTFIRRNAHAALYQKTPYDSYESTSLTPPIYEGEWIQGRRLLSAAHLGDDNDLMGLRSEHSLFMPALDPTGRELGEANREHEGWRIGLLVGPALIENLYVVDEDFVRRANPEEVPLFDPLAAVRRWYDGGHKHNGP